jgi:hypothetical protein
MKHLGRKPESATTSGAVEPAMHLTRCEWWGRRCVLGRSRRRRLRREERCAARRARLGKGLRLVVVVLLSSGIRAAHAGECLISGPHYQLKSDTVEWSLKLNEGQSCIRGVRLNIVAFASLRLIAPPQSGSVTLLGPGFSYTAMPNFHGEDSFAVEVTGEINRIGGSSTIRIAVSIADSSNGHLLDVRR